MRRRLAEETVLFISILKWFIISTVIGVVVGLATTFFLKLLAWSIVAANKHSYFFLFLPLAFFLSALIVKYVAPDAEGHGTEKVIEAIHKSSGKIKATVVPVKLIATIITIALGGSAGKEGPCAQIGGGLASMFADLFKFNASERKKLVICGISAGFASVFGTPIAGALFGVEVLFVGSILYDVLLPSFIAGMTSYHISNALGITYFRHPVHFIPQFNEYMFIKMCLAGIFFGLCSALMVEGLRYGKKWSQKLVVWEPLKAAIGGVVLVGLTLIFSKQYLGLGLNTIESCLEGQHAHWFDSIIKIIFTSITLNFGGSGGIVTPIFFVGATCGSWFASVTGLNAGTMAAIGLVSVLAGAANTPIAASVMAVELFGPVIAPYAAVSCVISFLMTGHRSVYPSQILSIRKSSSFKVNLGEEIEDIQVEVKLGEKSWSNIVKGVYIFLRKMFLKKGNVPTKVSGGEEKKQIKA